MGSWKDKLWTDVEISTLREVWPIEPKQVTLERLPNRSWSCAGFIDVRIYEDPIFRLSPKHRIIDSIRLKSLVKE